MMKMIANASGNVLLGALGAVVVGGVVGAGMVASFDSFLRQSRIAYVRAAMNALDTKIRYMAMQPYAYQCGSEKGGGALGGLDCQLTPGYFDRVRNVPLPGARCPAGQTTCGFRMDFTGNDENGTPFGYRVITTTDDTGASVQAGVFSYRLVYEGTDYALAPAGRDPGPDGKQLGMIVPREVLQSEFFDCAAITNAAGDGEAPVFQGFGSDGKPRCTGFKTCDVGSYAVAVDFKTMSVTCRPFKTPDKSVTCASSARQQMIATLNWHASGSGSVLDNGSGACGELPIAPLNGH